MTTTVAERPSESDVTAPPEVPATAGGGHPYDSAWSPSDDWAESRFGSGTEAPVELPADVGPRTVIRTFAFLDLCGSTAYLESAGPREAMAAVTEFRAMVRDVAARRGVRVAKWLGDGAMVVGVQSGPVVAAAAEVCARQQGAPLPARAGVAVSEVLLFDGDDYLGRAANFAARICDDAPGGMVLCDMDCAPAIPGWVEVLGDQRVEIRGMGEHQVLQLRATPDSMHRR